MKLKPADTWFSKCVRKKAGWRCEKCGSQFTEGQAGGLDCSHHYGRAKKSVRFAKENAAALCCGCHRQWHSHPIEGFKWLEEYIGRGMLDILREKAHQTLQIKKHEWPEIAKHYKAEFAKMEDGGDFQSWQ